MNYFYILLSDLDGSYYYGSTKNLKKRVEEHSSGKVFTTKSRLPMRLVYYEAYLTIESARKREHQVKKSGSIRTSIINRLSTRSSAG